MMKFFVPFAENKEQEANFYESIIEFVGRTMAVSKFDERKVRSLEFKKGHKNIKAEVGKYIELNSEIVIAILYDHCRKTYHICTPSRGVVRGESMIIQESTVIKVDDFQAN